jgi:hypothetical protein
MGQAKLRKQEIAMLKSGKIVRHITKFSWFNDIVDQNTIALECNNLDAIPAGHDPFNDEKLRLVGRYVWFTTEKHARCAGADSDLYFTFDRDELQLESWVDICNSFTDPKARRMAYYLNKAAVVMGDDPRKWYVSRTPVSLDNCLNKNEFPEMRHLANEIDEHFQRQCKKQYEESV